MAAKRRDRRGACTGLGLSIVRALAENLGGTVRVQHSSPEGTAFVLDLTDPPAHPS